MGSSLTQGSDLPYWIWRDQSQRQAPAGERLYFFRTFTVQGEGQKATIKAAASGAMEIYLNGQKVATSAELKQPVSKEIDPKLFKWGANHIAVFARAAAEGAGMVFQLVLEQEYGKQTVVNSDSEWRTSLDNPSGWNQPANEALASSWPKAILGAELGGAPWGNVFTAQSAGATAAEKLIVPTGFKAELLRSAKAGEGSWVCLAIDHKGRLILSPQEMKKEPELSATGGGLVRVTLAASGQVEKWEPLKLPVGSAMGLLWAFESLYLSGAGPEGRGLYRITDTDGDDVLETVRLLKKWPAGSDGEHGAHAIVLGPDGKLWLSHGNGMALPEGIDPQSPARHYGEDDLLPRIKDPVATFFDGIRSPYGSILRTDAEGKSWEVMAVGFRNQYDIDFNEAGDLFTYDSDMEWDVGLPWYRPTRVLHILPGAEFGFREGSAKMPDYYADTMGSVVDIGLGSPTGVKFGAKSNWPDAWKKAFYVMDWTYGRILAVHLQKRGQGYSGESEEFIKGPGLPVTDIEFGHDGAMYFTVGGRGTQSGLYRVSWTGNGRIPPVQAAGSPGEAHRQVVDLADRQALEAKPVSSWREEVLTETTPDVALNRFIALLRCGEASDRDSVIMAMKDLDLQSKHYLAALRVINLALSRHGSPSSDIADGLRQKLSEAYPVSSHSDSFRINRELSQLLVFLHSDAIVAPTLKLLDEAKTKDAEEVKKGATPGQIGPMEEQIWFARILCEVPAAHFTDDQRQHYFEWFHHARQFKGGNSFAKFIEVIRQRALSRLSPEQRGPIDLAWAKVSAAPVAPPSDLLPAPGRGFVKAWTITDLEPALQKVDLSKANMARGREIFHTLLCARCHKHGADGQGGVGPDLTGVSGRFSSKDILEAMIEPSKAISEQYQAISFTLKDGSLIAGFVTNETNESLDIYIDPFATYKQTIKKANIATRSPSKVSMMMPGLLNSLQEAEIMDLLKYLAEGR